MKKEKKSLIKDLLKKHTEGLTIIEIARALHMSRNTAAVGLAELKGAELLFVRNVGIAKLHYLKNKKNQKDLELYSKNYE